MKKLYMILWILIPIMTMGQSIVINSVSPSPILTGSSATVNFTATGFGPNAKFVVKLYRTGNYNCFQGQSGTYTDTYLTLSGVSAGTSPVFNIPADAPTSGGGVYISTEYDNLTCNICGGPWDRFGCNNRVSVAKASYFVKVEIADGDGVTGSPSPNFPVTILNPISSYIVTPTSFCPGVPVQLSWTNNVTWPAGNIFTFELSNGSGNFPGTVLGTSNDANATAATVTIPAGTPSSTAYRIRLTASNPGGTALLLLSSFVSIGPPAAPYILESEINTCAGRGFTFTASASGISSYQWLKDGVAIPGETGATYTRAVAEIAQSGNYSVIGKRDATCFSAPSSAHTLTVSSGPVLSDFSEPFPECAGSTYRIYLYVDSPESSGISYNYIWKKGDVTVKSETSTSTASNYVPGGGWTTADAGEYRVTVSATGCTASATTTVKPVSIQAKMAAPVLTANTANAPATLTATTGFDSYYWQKWNANSGIWQGFYTGLNIYETATEGKFRLRGNQTACGNSPYSNEITITAAPDPCASDVTAPTINSSPPSVSVACGAQAIWDVSGSDNCTQPSSLVYKYYITGGSAVGDLDNLKTGTGSGTSFSADAVVHLFAFDATGNRSVKVQIAVNVSAEAFNFTTVSLSSPCIDSPSAVSVTMPAMPEGTTLDFVYKINGGGTETKTATVSAGHVASFQTRNLTLADAGSLYLLRIQNHNATACGQDFNTGNVFAFSVVECQLPAGMPGNGLIAWYPFNGNANDESGHGLHGTGANLTSTTDRFGAASKAYDFNGSSSYIQVADNTTYFRPQSISISIWVNTRSNPTLLHFVSKPIQNLWSNSWGVGANFASSNNGQLTGWVGQGESNLVEVPSGVARVDNVWAHLVLTYDNPSQIARLYVNGVKYNEMSSPPIYYDNSPVLFGKDLEFGGSNYFMDGKLDDIAIYDRALTPSEITQMYHGPVTTAPGSGKALSFDGAEDYVDMHDHIIPSNGADFTVDFWVLNRSTAGIREFISQGPDGAAFFVGTSDNSNVLRAGDSWVSTGVELPLNKWTHVAIVKREGTGTIYLNGILGATNNNYYNWSGGSPTTFGRQYSSYGEHMDGALDEVRIWNAALTETEIRERMCRKITAGDSKYGNLLAYYSFDQQDANTLLDIKAGRNGVLLNGPAWLTSGAPIGDASAFMYGSGSSLVLSSPDGESMTVSNFTGVPLGAHLYLVNNIPNSTTGIEGVGGNNRYFGVHHFGGTNSTYQATYHYDGNPHRSTVYQPALFKRNDNTVGAWSKTNATISESARNLTVQGTNTEYMLGTSANPLPVTLISFSAKIINDDKVKLLWTTTEELNASHFEVERSQDAKRYEKVGIVYAAGTTNVRKDYALTDEMPKPGMNYYRLRQVDLDGSTYLSRVISVSLDEKSFQTIYPNPAKNRMTELRYSGPVPEIILTDLAGRRFQVKSEVQSESKLSIQFDPKIAPGLYLLKVIQVDNVKTHKVVVPGH